jgi:hypothetical protein
MIAAEVVLLILGFISISISFLVGNKKQKVSETESYSEETGARDIWTEKEEAMVREQIAVLIQEEKETAIAETTQILNQRSNDKIMEFDEFSSQLMEKIKHNHEEVVFMYNMLTEKEKELKELMTAKPAPKPEKAEPKEEKTVKQPEKEPRANKQAGALTDERAEQKSKPKPKPEKAVSHSQAEGISRETVVQKPEKEPEVTPEKPEAGAKNNEIVKMYKQGKSVLDISRELNVGQGEVKLMIALYGGKK